MPSDPKVWMELSSQVPGLVVLSFIVIYFVRALSVREKNFMNYLETLDHATTERMRVRDESLKLLGENCHAFQHDLADRNDVVMTKVSKALDRNSEAFARNSQVLDRIERTLEIGGAK